MHQLTVFQLYKFYPKIISYFIPLTLSLIFLSSCVSEELKVKDTCNQFMEGRRMLKTQRDSTLLKEITEDSLFALLMYNERYVQMLEDNGVPVSGPSLNINTKSVEIKDNCADCMMDAFESFYKIHLCKHDGKWKIEGENGTYPNSEKISKAKQKIIDYKEELKIKPAQDSVFKALGFFFTGVIEFFKTEESSTLKSICTDATFESINYLYHYSKKRTGMKIILEELDKPKYVTFDVNFGIDTVTCKYHNDEPEVNFIKVDGEYKVSGINGIDSKFITQKVTKEQYPMLLRALRILRKKSHEDKIVY